MRLPPELRVRIYDEIPVSDKPIRISGQKLEMRRKSKVQRRRKEVTKGENERRNSIIHTVLAVVHTCRQVYFVAAPRYYVFNTFSLCREYVWTRIRDFFTDIGPRNKDSIANIELFGPSNWEILGLENLNGAKSLTIVLASWYIHFDIEKPDFKETWIKRVEKLLQGYEDAGEGETSESFPAKLGGQGQSQICHLLFDRNGRRG